MNKKNVIILGLKNFAASKMQFLVKRIPFNYKKYWNNRYNKYGFNILYCGNEWASEEENVKRREKFLSQVSEIIKEFNIKKDSQILDVGCGIGVFAEYLYKNGFKNYTGIDLNKEIINNLNKKNLDSYKFKQQDIVKEKIGGMYDLIIMISVAGHIISDKGFNFAMKNIKDSLAKGGYFFVTERLTKDERDSFYTRRRTMDYYKKIFGEPIKIVDDFGSKKLIIFKNG